MPVHEVFRIFSRHRRKMAAFFLAVMAVTVAVTFATRPTYRSQAKLFVRLGRENVTLDPTATMGQTPVVTASSSRETEINSVLEILKSRALVETVVDAVGPEVVLGDAPPPAFPRPAPEEGEAERPSDPKSPRYKATVAVLRSLDVEAVKKSNVIQISYDGPGPEVCRAVVSRLIDSYLDQHLRLHRPSRSQEFLSEQAERLHNQLTRAEVELRDLKNQTGLAAPVEQRQLLVTRIGRLQDELLQTGGALAACEAEVRLLRERLAAMPKTQVTARATGLRNEAADQMRSQLYALELRELELLGKHPEQHPEVVAIRAQLATAREILAREERGRETVTTGPNHVYEETELALVKQEPLLASLKARAGALNSQLERERAALKGVNEDGLNLARLQREVELHEADYRKYLGGLEQAHIDRALEAERISNISVVQPATCDGKPVAPGKLLNLAVGLFVAAFGAAGLALACDRLAAARAAPLGAGKA